MGLLGTVSLGLQQNDHVDDVDDVDNDGIDVGGDDNYDGGYTGSFLLLS